MLDFKMAINIGDNIKTAQRDELSLQKLAQ
ncbi:hypothetical protein BH11BAC6_BH11BAC6_09820 [soil metagenome]